MKNIIITLIAIVNFTLIGVAQDKTMQSGNILFHAVDKKNVKATTKLFKSKINLLEKTVSFNVPIENFIFKNDLMYEHFLNENNMSVDLFPQATFERRISSNSNISKEGRHIVKVEGVMVIRGVSIPFSTNGLLTNKGNETYISATFLLDGTKFGLDNDKIKSFSDKIEVAIDAKY